MKENGWPSCQNGTLDCVLVAYSPRKRGLSPIDYSPEQIVSLFPAQAGVIPAPGPSSRHPDDYSPRKRGLSLVQPLVLSESYLFPAQAGGVILERIISSVTRSIPRASGGYPYVYLHFKYVFAYSPRKRGLSQFSSPHVGVIPSTHERSKNVSYYSPHTWGLSF